MDGVFRTYGLRLGASFARASLRYWLGVFPATARELRRRHMLARAIPNPSLRGHALRALHGKRGNLEGAAACELIAGRFSSGALVRALHACQTLCDYLDVLAEQPARDPVANGRQLHRALLDALELGAGGDKDYYEHHPHRNDGGYLNALVADVQAGLARLPALARIEEPLLRSAERIVAYQSFNHGDGFGCYAGFERWASTHARTHGLTWWEAGGGAGSTLVLYVLMAAAADRRLDAEVVRAIEEAYFPWIGALHSLLDSLADEPEDALTGERGLIACYESPQQAAERVCSIASEALARVQALPAARLHLLLLFGMTGFYLDDMRALGTPNARLVAEGLLQRGGRLTRASMLMMGARRVRVGCDADPHHAHAPHPPRRPCADSTVRVWR